ncbi:MAG: glutamine--tRNA ligase/YqeY domain fusion protein [Clostridia bacterium]|nr:glutamine--tRNA ligase/YqeY domain fusion protein [Clostridia bacterium]
MENFITEIIEEDLREGRVEGVLTRFPPEPNGYLHIGHAKSICLNFGVAEQYGGKTNLRFDDTNPTKEDVEYVDSIFEDIRWLGFQWDKLFYASDYFDQIFEFAVKLVKEGKAYVDDLSAEEIREYRGTLKEPGKNSPYRDRSVEENLDLFMRMKAGEFPDGSRVLRAKIDMSSPNLNMRDPVLYRILHASHHRTGDKWCIYPMYDFTHPISDAIEGITHSICTLEFEDHRPLYDWAVDVCGFEKKPHQYEFARLNLTNTVMSKRFLRRLVEEGKVEGWDDPRMPTICGIRHRGYPPEAVKKFCELVGVAKANSEVDYAYLEHCVRDYLNANAERAMAVKNPVKVVITNYEPGGADGMFDINPGAENAGSRPVRFGKEIYIDADDFSENPPPKYFRMKIGGVVRLKSAYIVRCTGVVKKEDGSIDYVECEYLPDSFSGNDTSGVKAKGTIQWVNAEHAVPTTFKVYGELLDPEKDAEDFMDKLNPNSLTVYQGYTEPYLREKAVGERFQFIRMGYYVKEAENTYIEIVGLKDSFKSKS